MKKMLFSREINGVNYTFHFVNEFGRWICSAIFTKYEQFDTMSMPAENYEELKQYIACVEITLESLYSIEF